MDIVIYPHPSLRCGGKQVTDFNDALRDTAKQMFEAMYRQNGVGLAAPQVGLDLALLVLNPTGDPKKPEEERAMVNPKIISKKGKEYGEEGCLSFPGIYGEVERSIKIVLEYQDLDGNPQELRADEFLARVIQHEFDHIEGVVFTDRMSSVEKLRIKKKLEDLEARYQPDPA